jgi:caspase domain-containing protein
MYTLSIKTHRGLRCLGLSAGLLAGLTGAAWAEVPASCVGDPIRAERVALVIGNSEYPEPVSGTKDAIDMACYLQQLGFTVIGPELDHDIKEIRDNPDSAFKKFGQLIPKAKVVVFFFSGHGLQSQGENYLLPKSARFSAKGLLSLSDVLKKISIASRDAVKIVILDACRNRDSIEIEDLTPDKEGLAKVEDETLGRNTIVGFATLFDQAAASGKRDENSPYTKVLLSHLREPGLEIRELLNRVSFEVSQDPDNHQQPWDEGGQNFDKPFFLRDQVKMKAKIGWADDNLLLLVNGQDVLSGKSQEDALIGLRAGDNSVEVRIFNDRTYRNHHTWESAEGWSYELEFMDAAGRPLDAPWEDHEEAVFKDGPHHGKWFTVARTSFYVDPGTAKLTPGSPDKDVWKREGTPSDKLEGAFLCKMTVLPALPFLGRNTETLFLVGGPRRLSGKVQQCFKDATLTSVVSLVVSDPGSALQAIQSQSGDCAGEPLWYALEDHPVGELRSVPDCH